MSDPIPSFDYFVVRLNRSDPHPDRITGLVERLGSGEKQPFATAEHLVRLLSNWTPSGSGGARGRFAQAPEVRGG